mmetsp:Transcript_34976/g.76507  ORF Transcript_34976/g.76507 Transcript_34976/m.76507 type:complete len:449 (+) Transcript_34976:251-1597(+)
MTTLFLLLTLVRHVRSFAPPATHLTPTTFGSTSRRPSHLEAAASDKNSLALAGKIAPLLSKFAIDGTKASKIGSAVKKSCNWVDLVVITVVGWCLEPTVRFMYEKLIEPWRKKDFDKTYLFYAWKLVSEASRIAAIVYAVDVLDVAFTALGVQFAEVHAFGDITASALYTAWIGRKLSNAKRNYLRHRIKQAEGGNKTGKFFLYNRIFDILITIGAALRIADAFQISKSNTFGRFFALGSVGTLVLSLASKGIAEQFVGGLALSTTDKFYDGDSILLGDGTSGTVENIGWMSTEIRRGDETVVRIPNSQIASQRVTNLSRSRLSQVKQTLRFKYSDIDKIPQLQKDIRKQVQEDCPLLITDGSRPCRVHWKEFSDDHIEVGVDFRFRIPIIGNAYHDNKEKCNLAIAKAMKKNGVEFAIPTTFHYEYSLNDYGRFAGGELHDAPELPQ